ncbi:tail tube monomer [uncultured Mediterranean phage]|nr:tail tube monomer [uncultured Mediterranean phage]|tara:strand:+ start:3384 stop:3974 length:591 start_codon:yes stop_codon:yes gene_type:complete
MATSRENKTISQFKSALIGGGARPNLFEVELTTLPAGIDWDANSFRYMCKAAQLPAQNIANIDVPFRGRIFKIAGDRTIDTWTVTIINDESFNLRRAFEQWSELIAKLDNNLGATDPSAYMTNAKVFQLGRGSTKSSQDSTGETNSVLAEYEFVDIFPTSVAAIDLSYDSSDAIEEFTVEFQVQSFRAIAAGGSNG